MSHDGRWRAVLILTLALAVASGRARADAGADDEAFRRWAEKQHRPICAWGALAHKDSKVAGRFVWFNDPAQPHVHRVVLESAGKRWLLRKDERADWGGQELTCTPEKTLAWSKLDALTLEYAEKSDTDQINETITLLDGEPVLLSRHSRGYHDESTTDWVEGTDAWDDPHPLEDENLPSQNQHMLFALPEGSRWWAKVPAPPVDVTFGRKRWTGKADADLSVRVLTVPEGFRVELAATDDRVVPPVAGADARAVVRADHFELWFCPAGDCQRPPAQLAVARDGGGGVLAMWLRPNKPEVLVPNVALDKDRLVVTLPYAILGAYQQANGEPTLVPLTVAYSDSDDPAAGQQTMVATASIKKANPDQPSLLAAAGGDRPFPRWPRAKPLGPGEDIFAEDPACSAQTVAKLRAEASAPLKSGATAEAAKRIDALITRLRDQCLGRVPPDEHASMCNDVALAHHKIGDDTACVRALGRIYYEGMSPAAVRTITFTNGLCGAPCTDASPGCREGKAARAAAAAAPAPPR